MKISKAVQQWIKYARTDLSMAKASLGISSQYKNGAAFLAQQSSEKIVKAYLTSKKVRTPKTHDMELLLAEVARIDPVLAKRIAKAESLTVYAVTYRYPDAERKTLTVTKVKKAIQIADEVFEACLEAVKSS
ncbi:MAG: HEPN domain-containing protein [Bdellovibrionaceae bacterium]|nr:HEPN domain-containing protein [Pseudobdellovibrionaceae bacterium]